MSHEEQGSLFRPGMPLWRRVLFYVLCLLAAGAYSCVLEWTGAAL